MNDTITLRPRFGQVLTILVVVIVASALVGYLIGGDPGGLLLGAWPLLLVAYLTWLMFWSPSVTVDPAGVVLRNLVRERRITWPAIERIDTKYALTLFTAHGTFTAWAAPAPSRLSVYRASRGDLGGLPESTYGAGGSIRPGDLPSSESGQAGMLVRLRYEQLRDAGHLDGAIEGTGVTSRWLAPEIAALAALVAATVLALLL